MTKGKSDLTAYDSTTLQEEDIATNQEAIPVPLFSGTQLVALRWVSDGIAVYAKQQDDNAKK